MPDVTVAAHTRARAGGPSFYFVMALVVAVVVIYGFSFTSTRLFG